MAFQGENPCSKSLIKKGQITLLLEQNTLLLLLYCILETDIYPLSFLELGQPNVPKIAQQTAIQNQ